MFTALAENFGNIREKVNLFIALCPITNLGYSTAGIMKQASSDFGYNLIAGILSSFGIHELRGPRWQYVQAAFCLVFPCDGLIKAFSDA